MTKALKLRIELVPAPLWGINLRSNKTGLGKWRWTKLRRRALESCGGKCIICKSPIKPQGHEVWEYRDRPRVCIAKLVRVEIVCQACHHINHWGRTNQLIWLGVISDEGRLALRKHFRTVNRCLQKDFDRHEKRSFARWKVQSEKKWKVDWGDFQPAITEAKMARRAWAERQARRQGLL